MKKPQIVDYRTKNDIYAQHKTLKSNIKLLQAYKSFLIVNNANYQEKRDINNLIDKEVTIALKLGKLISSKLQNNINFID